MCVYIFTLTCHTYVKSHGWAHTGMWTYGSWPIHELRNKGTVNLFEYSSIKVALKGGCYLSQQIVMKKPHVKNTLGKWQHTQYVKCNHNPGLRYRIVVASWHNLKVVQDHWIPEKHRIQAKAYHPQGWAGKGNKQVASVESLSVPSNRPVLALTEAQQRDSKGTRHKEALGNWARPPLGVPTSGKGALDVSTRWIWSS